MLYIIMLYIESVNERSSVTIQMKATEQHFPKAQCIMLYTVGVTFESVKENVKCEHSNESY